MAIRRDDLVDNLELVEKSRILKIRPQNTLYRRVWMFFLVKIKSNDGVHTRKKGYFPIENTLQTYKQKQFLIFLDYNFFC